MGQTYYCQSEPAWLPKTMTVGELRRELEAFGAEELVIFESPNYGTYGPLTGYSIDRVARVALLRTEIHTPAETLVCEDTGEPYTTEAETQVFHAWTGVVIS